MSPRPNILMLTTQLGYGGAETSFIRLANYLSQTMEVTVALFMSHYGGVAYSQNHEPLNAKVVLLDGDAPTRRLQRWWRRRQKLRTLKAQHDVCISFLSGPNTLNVLAGHHRKTIVSLRGPRKHDANTPPIQRRIFQYLLDPITLNLAAKIVPVSSGLCNEVHQLGGPWNLKKVTVISPFVLAESHLARAQEAVPEAYAALKGQPLMVGAGRLSVEKHFQYLIPVFAEVAKQVPGAKLLLVGDGPMLQTLRNLAAGHGLALDDVTPGTASVIFADYQKNPLMFMAIARLFVFPSGTEGVPNILLEALATGTPIVAADAAWGARSLLAPGDLYRTKPYPTTHATPAEYGILMPRSDDARYAGEWVRALVQGLQSEQWRTTYGEKGKQHMLTYDLQHIAPKWVQLIQQLIAENQP